MSPFDSLWNVLSPSPPSGSSNPSTSTSSPSSQRNQSQSQTRPPPPPAWMQQDHDHSPLTRNDYAGGEEESELESETELELVKKMRRLSFDVDGGAQADPSAGSRGHGKVTSPSTASGWQALQSRSILPPPTASSSSNIPTIPQPKTKSKPKVQPASFSAKLLAKNKNNQKKSTTPDEVSSSSTTSTNEDEDADGDADEEDIILLSKSTLSHLTSTTNSYGVRSAHTTTTTSTSINPTQQQHDQRSILFSGKKDEDLTPGELKKREMNRRLARNKKAAKEMRARGGGSQIQGHSQSQSDVDDMGLNPDLTGKGPGKSKGKGKDKAKTNPLATPTTGSNLISPPSPTSSFSLIHPPSTASNSGIGSGNNSRFRSFSTSTTGNSFSYIGSGNDSHPLKFGAGDDWEGGDAVGQGGRSGQVGDGYGLGSREGGGGEVGGGHGSGVGGQGGKGQGGDSWEQSGGRHGQSQASSVQSQEGGVKADAADTPLVGVAPSREERLQAKKERRKARRKARRAEERAASQSGMGMTSSVPSSVTSSSFRSQTSLSGTGAGAGMGTGMGHSRSASTSTCASGNSAQYTSSSQWTDIGSGIESGSQNYDGGAGSSRKMSSSSSRSGLGAKTESIRPEDSASRRASFNTSHNTNGFRAPVPMGSPFSPTTLTDTTTTTTSSGSSKPSAQSHGFGTGFGSRRLLEEDESSESGGESVVSYEEGSSSLDAFFANEGVFLGDERNKLRVWQGLCLELGLAVLPPKWLKSATTNPNKIAPSPPGSTYSTPPSTPRGRTNSFTADETPSHAHARRRSTSADSHKTINENDISRASTPTNPPVILPNSLKGCKELLKSRGHVNIKDYMEERDRVREKRRRLIAEKVRVGSNGGEVERLTMEEEDELRADLRDLVYPNAGMMAIYTRSSRRLAKKKLVKEDWLQPLMRYIYSARPHNCDDDDH